jgi:hypothetical protein
VQEPIEEEGHHDNRHRKAQHRSNEMIAPVDGRHGQRVVEWGRRLEQQPQQRDGPDRPAANVRKQSLDERMLNIGKRPCRKRADEGETDRRRYVTTSALGCWRPMAE